MRTIKQRKKNKPVRWFLQALIFGLGIAPSIHGVPDAHASDQVLTVTWADLLPPATTECPGQKKKTIDCRKGVYDIRQHRCGLIASDLGNERVRIAGYAHPVKYEFKSVQRFLLTPPPSPCTHPTPPPPNQLILVEWPEGIDINFDPIFVTGVIQIKTTRTDIATAKYFIRAELIEPARIPDVSGGK